MTATKEKAIIPYKEEFNEINRAKARRFLRCYAHLGTVAAAAKLAKISSSSHKNWLENDPVYAEAFDRATELNTDELESIAIQRAKKSSDLLMIFLLKARRPDIYREQKVITGDPNSPVRHEMRINLVRTDNRENYLITPQALGPGTDSD